MTHDRATPNTAPNTPYQRLVASSYYGVLGVHPSASVREIRQAYRELSKQFHPDTTTLPCEVATVKFQQLNEAYATLSSPERRLLYDRKIGYSSVAVVQPSVPISPPRYESTSAYLDPTDRPLSAGEVFALFILGVTFLACLLLAVAIGLTKGEAVLQAGSAVRQLAPLTTEVDTPPTGLTAQPAPMLSDSVSKDPGSPEGSVSQAAAPEAALAQQTLTQIVPSAHPPLETSTHDTSLR